MKNRLLIVDDEFSIRFAIGDYFETLGYTVFAAESISAAKNILDHEAVSVIIADYQLGDGTALDLLAFVRGFDTSIPVIVLTGNATYDLAVRTIQEGAVDFVPKPVAMEVLKLAITKAANARKAEHRLVAVRSRTAKMSLNPFLGQSKAIQAAREEAELALTSDMPVLLLGETGTGKGVIAAWLHFNGHRQEGAFVDLNAATLSREFLETELFGHEKGAFTGSAGEKKGLLEIADEGTLFLDEIGDLDPAVQPKLLKVLEENRFRRLGGVRERVVDVRLIAATSQNLSALVQQKRFRSDLYFRINALTLHVPSLRERVEDIPVLAETMLAQLRQGKTAVELDSAAHSKLQSHRWPGNLRELRNTLERAVLRARGERISADNLQLDYALEESPGTVSREADLRTLAEVEAEHILRVHEAEGRHVDRTAVRLGISRSSLYMKLKALGLLATHDKK